MIFLIAKHIIYLYSKLISKFMYYRKVVCSIIILFLFTYCTSNSSIENRDIFPLSSYLKRTFDKNIDKNDHNYIFIPKKGCPICLEKTIDILNGVELLKYKESITIIYSNSKIITNEIKACKNVLFDSLENMNNYNLNISNVTLISVRKQSIDTIVNFNTENYKDILDFIDDPPNSPVGADLYLKSASLNKTQILLH